MELLRWHRGTFRWSKAYWNGWATKRRRDEQVELGTIFQSIIGAGIGSALIQGVLPFVRDNRERAARASHMAIRLAVGLEAYAAACHDLIAYNTNAEVHPEERLPNWKAQLPELAEFPADTEGWRALDRQLAGRCLSFRNKVAESQGLINETIYYNDDNIGDAVEVEATARGLEAWRLASALRRKHKVEAAEPVWDYIEHLERSEKRIEGAAEKRRSGS